MKLNRDIVAYIAMPVFALGTALPLWAEEVPSTGDKNTPVIAESAEGQQVKVELTPKEPDEVTIRTCEPKQVNFRTALARTAEFSSELRSARSEIEQAKWDTEKVLTGHNPRLSFVVNYNLNTPESVLRMGNFAMTVSPTHAYNGALVLEQSICTFGRLHYSELVARLTEELKRESFRNAFEDEMYDTASAYVDCLLARDQVAISKRQLELREQSLRDAEALFNAGTTARFDVLRVNTSVSTARQVLTVAENNYKVAMAKLCERMCYPVDTELELRDVIVDKAVPVNIAQLVDFNESLRMAMECRPELHMLDWAKQVAEANYKLAGSSMNPNFALQSSLIGNGSNSNLGQSWGWSWATGLVFNVPIYDGGVRRAEQGKIREAIKQLDYNTTTAISNIKLDVKNCHSNLEKNWTRIGEAKTALEQAQEADRVAMVRYKAGLSTSTELLDAHTALGTSQEALSTAKYGYFLSVVDWVRAISGTYPIDNYGFLDRGYLDAKGNDWYDLRKMANDTYDKVMNDRLEDPSDEEINADYHKYWHDRRDRMHENGYKRAGMTEPFASDEKIDLRINADTVKEKTEDDPAEDK